MIDKLKVINFLQDCGCAKLEHLQILFDSKDNFKSILSSNMVSKKGDIFVHNIRKIDSKMLIALDVLCKFKEKLSKYYFGLFPIEITFLSKDNLIYHIIVADMENAKGIVKVINSYHISLPKADKLILVFPDEENFKDIECDIPFIYTTYPDFKIINE